MIISNSGSKGGQGMLCLHPLPGHSMPALGTLPYIYAGRICLPGLFFPAVHCSYQNACQLLFITLTWLLPQLFSCWLQKAWVC